MVQTAGRRGPEAKIVEDSSGTVELVFNDGTRITLAEN